MDMTQDTSSPAYFEKTFGVDPAQAAELSSQAKSVSLNRGGGIMTEAPVAAPAAPTPAAPNAQAEYDALMKDRADGKMTNAQWNATGANRAHELAELIANGAGTQPVPQAGPPAQAHPYLGAPASPNDYGLLQDVTDEQLPEVRTQQEALSRLNLERRMVLDVRDRLRSYAAEFEHATPEVVHARVEANHNQFIAQCAREGIDAAQAESLIGAQLKAWSTAEPSVRPLLENIVKLSDPRMLDYILQIAKFNRAQGK